MSGRRVRFRQADVARAVRAVTSAGVGIARVEIDQDGKIVIVSGPADPAPEVDELAAWRAGRNARAS